MTQPAEPTPDAVSDEAIEWYVLMRSGVASECERRRFAEWLAADLRHARAYAETERLWAQMCSAARQGRGDRTRIAPRRTGWSRRMPLGIAAAALLAAVVLLHGGHPLDAWLSDYHSGVGEQRELSLPDGTVVLLDTDSAISLDFGKRQRRVRLDRGRALFTATADPEPALRGTHRDADRAGLGDGVRGRGDQRRRDPCGGDGERRGGPGS